MPRTLILETQGSGKKKITLNQPVFKIGKHASNDLVLNQVTLSRFHCEIHLDDQDQVSVKDCGSRNGTYLNGSKINGLVKVADLQSIQVGQFILKLQPTESSSSNLPAPKVQASPVAVRAEESNTSLGKPQIPGQILKTLHGDLLNSLDLKRMDVTRMSPAEIRAKTVDAVKDVIKRRSKEIPANISREGLIKEMVDQSIGLGPLEELLAQTNINEIMVNSFDKIYIEQKGKIVLSNRQFLDNAHVIEIIRRIIAPIGRRIDESSPMVDARLADGSRVNAIIPPLAISGPTLTIRKFSATPFEVEDLVGFGSLTDNMAKFLKLSVKHRKNILISGGTGSGKTTLLNVISGFIPDDERIVTIEDAAELRLPQEHVVSLESKPPNIEGEGAIPIRKLVINSLRMRPDRIIVGECRGGEALDMLQAMNTGHDGSLTTLHANSCRDAISRLETLVLMAGMELPAKAIMDQIASAVDIIVQISRFSDGSRRITNITAVVGKEGDVITLQDVFAFKQTGYTAEGKIDGHYEATGTIPEFVHDIKKRGMEVDLGIFK